MIPAVLVALAVLGAPPAHAQEEGYLLPDDVLPGSCGPDPVVVGQQVDCRFPLARAGELDPYAGPYEAVAGDPDPPPGAERAGCLLEGGDLVCRGLSTPYPAGTTAIRVDFGWPGATGVVAEVHTLDWTEVPVVITGFRAEPYLTAERPWEVWIQADGEPEILVRIRERESGEVAATLAVPPADEFGDTAVDVSSLPPGRYRAQPCLGTAAGPEGCREVPGAGYFQVGTGLLEEIVPGANRPGSDRINLVLAGSGFEDHAAFRETAVALLGLDGPMLLDVDGAPAVSGVQVAAVEWGPFATEPLRSHRHRFDLWLLTDPIADPEALFWLQDPSAMGLGPQGTPLSDVQVTTIELLPPGAWKGSEAGFPSFTSMEPGLPDRDGLRFAGAYVALPGWFPLAEADTLTHELGHALFDLRDEYTNTDRFVQHGYPNCAPDVETAREWWSNLEGEVDPFLWEYLEVMEEHEQYLRPADEMAEMLRVGYVEGGCYALQGSSQSVRPTSESIMNAQTPVFGSVNRRRAEEIMRMWSGRDVLRSTADLEVSCSRTEGDPWKVVCRGALAPLVDPPDGGLHVSAGGDRVTCRASAAEGDGPVDLVCGPLQTSGYDPVEVAVGAETSDGLASLTVPAVAVAPLQVTLGLGGRPPPVPEPSGFPVAVAALILAASTAVGLTALGWVMERRRRR